MEQDTSLVCVGLRITLLPICCDIEVEVQGEDFICCTGVTLTPGAILLACCLDSFGVLSLLFRLCGGNGGDGTLGLCGFKPPLTDSDAIKGFGGILVSLCVGRDVGFFPSDFDSKEFRSFILLNPFTFNPVPKRCI